MKALNGLYAVTPDCADTALLTNQVETVLAAGVRFVQFRNKTADAALRLQQAKALKLLCARYTAHLIINDDVNLAAAIDADGVHVGIDDTPLADARARLGHDKIIGVSCYDQLARAREAAHCGADYIAFGSFFASSVKPNAVRVPLSLLQEARAFGRPLVAIGGITHENARQLIQAGADAVAVISAVFAAADPAAAARGFCQLFEAQPA